MHLQLRVSWIFCAALLGAMGCSERGGKRLSSDGGPEENDAAATADSGAGTRGDPRADGGGMSTPTDGGGGFEDCVDPIDVVFVVDVSTSMDDEIAKIREGITSIWNAANELTEDTQFGLVVFVDDVVAVDDCAPFDGVDGLQDEFARWREFTSSNRQPGGSLQSNRDCPENSLDALHTAATTCPWRAGATRLAIHVTDDTFAEPPARLSGVAVDHGYGETLEALTENEVRVGAFAAPTPENCGAGRSENTAQGFFEPYEGTPAVPEETGGRAWSIRDVRAGELDMATAINELIEDEHCTPF